ncbi:MAG: AtpZ/AtpI family protein [Bacteroidales bacterium]|nr:AtpZ/AtpI family protein [Bacteroidales bacterium]
MSNPKSEEKPKNTNRGLNNIIRFSSLAFEMGIMICIGAFGGDWLDNHFENDRPWFTIVLSLLAVIGSIYLVIKSLMNVK